MTEPTKNFEPGQYWALRNGGKVKIVTTELCVAGFTAIYPIGGIVYEDGDVYLQTFTLDGALQDIEAPSGLDITYQLSDTHET